MKANRLSFDFSDNPHVVRLLRQFAAQRRTSQKAIVIEALESLFADKLESALVQGAAQQTFKEWDNEEDSIYDTL